MEEGLKYLNDLTWAYRASRTLQCACLLKLFTRLSVRPMTAEQLSAQCGSPLQKLEKLLIACCAIGLLNKHDALYENSALSDKYLVEGRPQYQGNIVMHAANVWNVWTGLPFQLVDNPSETAGSEHENFILGMHNLTMAGRGDFFLQSVNLSGRKRLLDVGGGPGTYSIFACKRYPVLQSTLFDIPETIAIARSVIEKEGMLDRISLRSADWDVNDFGSGFDVVLMSNVLHGPNSNAPGKLRKAYNCMEPGGLLAVQEFMLNDDKTGPTIPALFSIMVGAYSRPELFAAIEQAGFENVRIAAQDDSIGSTWITALK
ncbi:MAG: methyltransferase domain-containing protein [Planctomycetaceae bacterium]|nr:methyltransferase domain-containing protein [Planctomycetaceae bacterium]